MAISQHYYTSYVNKETGSAGFQVKAMSPGITADTQSTITRLISYRIPPTLDEYDIASHPVALRYFYRNPQEAILLCSQSNGTDENGRPGNFFAHSLVSEPDYFSSMPPILYWRSSFWRAKDPGTSAVVAPIRSLEEIEIAYDIEGVWRFLAQGSRIEQFHKLMCAVVHCSSTQRRIVIVDKADNVAQWIAAITIMLPPDYRPLLSFATYHHDPYQSQFIVTGTTSDSSFRASPDEYMSYFVLNTQMGKVSDVEASPYADEVLKAARSYDDYESKFLSLITDYTPRFPRPTQIDEQLDMLALYAGMVAPNHPHSFILTSKEVEAMHVALTAFEKKRNFAQEDIDEVRQAHYLLHGTHQSQDSEEVDLEYRRSVALLKKHKIPTDQSALAEMKYVTQHLIGDLDLSVALQRLKNMQQTYDEDTFIAIINSASYMQWLGQYVNDINELQLASIWRHLGIYFNPSQYSSLFIIAGLKKLGVLWNNRQATQEAKELFAGMAQAVKGREKEWLQLIVASYTELPERILRRFYCRMVWSRSLHERAPYRAIVRRVEPGIDKAEMHFDIEKAGAQKGLAVFETWITYARQQQLASLPDLMNEGLKHLTQDAREQAPEIAAKILMNQALAPLPIDWENNLVSMALSQVSLSHYTPLDLEMCKKYRTREGISDNTRTVMDGLLAMTSGELSEKLAHLLQARSVNMRPSDYQAETTSFVSKFLQMCATSDSHQRMVNTYFEWGNLDTFWQAYWHTFTDLLAFGDPATARQAMKLLSFWFASVPGDFTTLYLLQYFFIELPQQLEAARQVRGFQDSVRVINASAEKEQWRWYPLVQDYFTGRKSAILSMGQNLAAQIWKGRTQDGEEARKQAEREQKEHALLDERIGALFGKKLRQQHNQMVGEIYVWQQRELFWSIYWTYFKALFDSSNSMQPVLDLLAFWFDDSFNILRRKIYIPQQFFLDLQGVIVEVQKERGFREFARNLSRIDKRQGQTYQWLGLAERYFVEQEKRFGLFRR